MSKATNPKKLSIAQINERIPANSKLEAIEYAEPHFYPNGRSHGQCLFLCKCGNTFKVPYFRVINGNTKSCGCSYGNFHFRKYTVTIKKLRTCYTDMIRRCYVEKCANHANYGALGVKVCDEWKNSYQAFLDWSLANGYKPGLALDKDKKGDGKLYSPETCCWLTTIENNKYTSRKVLYTLNGKQYNVRELSEISGINNRTLRSRLTRQRLSVEEAISIPIKNKK